MPYRDAPTALDRLGANSPFRTAVLRDRLACGEPPFHDQDAYLDDDGEPCFPPWPRDRRGQLWLTDDAGMGALGRRPVLLAGAFRGPPCIVREANRPRSLLRGAPAPKPRRERVLEEGAAWGRDRNKVLWQRLLWAPKLGQVRGAV